MRSAVNLILAVSYLPRVRAAASSRSLDRPGNFELLGRSVFLGSAQAQLFVECRVGGKRATRSGS